MKQFSLKTSALALCALALGALGTSLPASAGVFTYDFTLDNCSSPGCGLSNYGTVTVTDLVGGGVTVDVSLLHGAGLIDTGALGKHTMVFNLAGSPTINVTGLPSLWTVTSHTSYAPPNGLFGTFDTIIDCNAGCGANSPYTHALDFTITTSSITTASFIDGGTGADAYFVADISNPGTPKALTGRVGAAYVGHGDDDPPVINTPTKVPEPFTLSLFATGLAGAAALRRRKQQTA
jgi:hypothetical protein